MNMQRLKLIQYLECPPDQFRYKFREDGYMVKCFDYSGWLERIKEHRRINNYPTPEDWVAEAEDQLCKLLPPGWCRQDTGEPPEWFIDSRVGVDEVLRGTQVLASFVVQGMPLVDKSLAAERGAICAGCPFAANAAGCGPCVGLSNLIAEVAGTDALPSDALLANKSCLICGCAARAQIWLPIELLAKGVTPEMDAKWPEWCWKGKALNEFRQSVSN